MGYPESRKRGLKPWQPGQSGNPGGRPKKRPITDEYFALADIVIPEQIRKKIPAKFRPAKGTTFSQANALRRYIDMLMKDGHRAAKEVREAMEGKAPQRIEISGPDKKEITIRIKSDRKNIESKE